MKNRFSFTIPMLWFWAVLFFAYQFGIRVSIPNVLNGNLQKHFAIGSKELGTMISGAYMAYTLMQIPVGVFIDKVSLKKIMFFSSFFTSFLLIVFVCTKSVFIASISQVILGAAMASGFTMIFKIANICFSKEKVAFATCLAFSISSLWTIGFNLILAYLTKEFYWKNIVIAVGIIGLILSVILLLFIRDIENDTLQEARSYKTNMFNMVKIIFSERKLLLIGFFSMAVYGTGAAFSEIWGVLVIKHVYETDIITATSVVSMYFVGEVIGGPLLACLVKILKSYAQIMFAGSILLFFTVFIITFGKINLRLLYFTTLLFGIAASSNTFSFLSAMSLLPKKLGGSVAGTLNTMSMVGSAIVIPIMGFAIDFSKGFNVAYCSADYQCGLIALLFSSAASVIAAFCVKKLE